MSKLRFGALLLMSAAIPATMAQTSRALITGLVTDGTGAVVAGAKITVTDIQRNQEYKTESNLGPVPRD